MLKEDLDFIKSRSWYQTIDFGEGIKSSGCAWCGDPAWGNIKKLLPANLKGMNIMDLGCNAGIFCIRAAQMGAAFVVGVDWPGWRPKWDFLEQREFVRDYFEREGRSLYPIHYETGKMEDFVKRSWAEFDYVLAIASIYYTGTPRETVENIAKFAKNVILRLRDDNRIAQFTKLFEGAGYKREIEIKERWWETLGHQTDDFYLYLYSR